MIAEALDPGLHGVVMTLEFVFGIQVLIGSIDTYRHSPRWMFWLHFLVGLSCIGVGLWFLFTWPQGKSIMPYGNEP